MLYRIISLVLELVVAAIIAVAMFALELVTSPLAMLMPDIWGYTP